MAVPFLRVNVTSFPLHDAEERKSHDDELLESMQPETAARAPCHQV